MRSVHILTGIGITTGVYNYTRNPMYLGMALIGLAYTYYKMHILGLLFWVVYFLYMTRFQIIPEEKALIKIFEDDYKEYCIKVRRWI
ncbi:MAG: hypothetical protein COB02_18450 [Candidatus Cloacimonadota bacterium]|nr:MAG: hypothetical protein COB02_18450 [Candidatus Cloacimonadota bacterium]